ncbi:HlyD family efflux transporter periplasmic adaptor subunit [Roseicyclus sp. F158]|uniref:HlyD family efflux transporter periplasmic adaptor subunit n=1 Tax=Tropicimonas omnivorans TaxID=3075590 RepID=A0ABU3DJR8_9RHOB|nr:HlyD family efflux transporter periplasmic adaptor subunit [Roseicyclus sp. F158]MDT0683960.1 HlyD family efflux transporter periplasmic adaptor subunit [Roseicyclus sp. F158]
MRIIRFGIGLLLIIAAIWVIIGEQLSGASANAFVNTRLVTLRSPIAGTVTLEQETLGARMESAEMVASVQDPQADRVRRNDIAMEVGIAGAEIARLEKELVENASHRADAEARLATYRAARIRELETELEHATGRLDILRERGSLDPEDQELAEILDEDTVRTRAEPTTYALALNYAEERFEKAQIALDALRSDGIFLGDGYNDAPYSGQRLDALRQEEASLRLRLQEARASRRARTIRLTEARAATNRAATSELTSPVQGLLWELHVADGETVQRGDAVATLADCSSVILSLSVTENVYNTLRLGQSATFRPSGVNQTFEGTISRLAGSGADTIYRNLAVQPGPRHLERYDVTLLIPRLAADPQLACAIGRTGRVFFDARPLDWLRRDGGRG